MSFSQFFVLLNYKLLNFGQTLTQFQVKIHFFEENWDEFL